VLVVKTPLDLAIQKRGLVRRAGLAQRVGGAVELALAVIGPADHRPHRPVVDEGKLKKERVLVVKTPLDLAIQKRADQAVENARHRRRRVAQGRLDLALGQVAGLDHVVQHVRRAGAYMGGGTFGAAAAADYYFGKNLKDITLPEAAMLVAGLRRADWIWPSVR
jgi:hypothetical protein